MTDLLKDLDALSCFLFMLNWNRASLEARFGKQEVTELEDETRDAISLLGISVLSAKSKVED